MIVKKFENFQAEIEVEFKSKKNPSLNFRLYKTPDGRIIRMDDKPPGIRFPFNVGMRLNRNVEVWACNNGFLMDGKDTCPEKKVFGVKAKNVPKGHQWRTIFPNKFR